MGIAVGVVGAALLGLLAGWLILGRGRRINNTEPPAPAQPSTQTNYYELAKQPQQYPYEVAGEPVPPVRYELSPELRQ